MTRKKTDNSKYFCCHNKWKYTCKQCQGSQLCEHGIKRCQCRECGGFQTLARCMYHRAKQRSKQKDLQFNVTVEHIVELIGKGVCPVFGTPYKMGQGVQSDASASLHKIKPQLGYIIGNCAVISQLANTIMTNASVEQIYRVYRWVRSESRRKRVI
jgi:hypothetical protein